MVGMILVHEKKTNSHEKQIAVSIVRLIVLCGRSCTSTHSYRKIPLTLAPHQAVSKRTSFDSHAEVGVQGSHKKARYPIFNRRSKLVGTTGELHPRP